MKLLRRIAWNNNKSNKTRSILVIISIVLTTVLLTSIGTFGYGAVKSNNEHSEKLYGSYYGAFKGVTRDQYDDMKLNNAYTDIGINTMAGNVKNDDYIALLWSDEVANKLTNGKDKLEKGKFPEESNEIAGSKEMFRSLGYKESKIGDSIKLESRFDDTVGFEEKEFIISGILKDENLKMENKMYSANISEKFYMEESSGSIKYTVFFRLNENIEIDGDTQEKIIKDLGKELGLEERQVILNKYYLGAILMPKSEVIIGTAVISLLVIIFSIMVIYNIFQIGILQKIQEYGKLKALGTTKKQVRKIVVNEGMSLAYIGIPIGLLLGAIIGNELFNFLMIKTNTAMARLELGKMNFISIPVLLIVALISLITVRLSLIKPIKIVSNISPVEAIRFQGNSKNINFKRKGKNTIRLKEIIFSNFSINRGRTIKTIFTMGLSCVFFVIISNIASNLDAEYETRKDIRYGEFYISLNYSYDDKAYPEKNLDYLLKYNPLDEDFIEKVKNISGVTEVKTRDIAIVEELDAKKRNSQYEKDKLKYTDISVINEEDFNLLTENNEKGNIGNLNYKDIVKKDGVFHFGSTYFKEEGYKLNEDINFSIDDGVLKKEFNSTVEGAFFRMLPTNWAITEETYNKLGLKNNVGFLWVDCNEEDRNRIEEELNILISENEQIQMSTYKEKFQENESGMYLMKLLSYSFLILLGLIGFMNMANTIIISIITRKREFGILQAIGMTNKQLNHMLQVEGLIFTIGTIIISLIIGMPLGIFAFDYLKNEIGMIGLNNYNVPIMEILIMILAILLLQGILSFILSRNVKKDSLVDRIRF